MDFGEKFNFKPMAVLKIFGIAFIGVLLLALMFQVFGSIFRSISPMSGVSNQRVVNGYSKGMASSESAYSADSSMGISTRNIVGGFDAGVTSGDTAENFEITQYFGTIETRFLRETCEAISALKQKEYVIFENANESDNACYYSFKVKQENVSEILAVVDALEPKDLSENTRTIKQQIDDYTSETEILNKKRETIENTLEDAVKAYDEISRVATQARDAESLAKIIDSKIQIIERLSQERITISEQIDRINRAKAEQLDRLAYTYFSLNVYENKFVDTEEIGDSWKDEIKRSVRELNEIAQNVSINLVTVGFRIFEYLLYIILILIAAKYFWRFAVYFWKK